MVLAIQMPILFSFHEFLMFFMGALVALGVAWVLSWKTLKTANRRAQHIIDLAMKESALVTREMRTHTELELEKKQVEFDKEMSSRQLRMHALEQELQDMSKDLEEQSMNLKKRQKELSRHPPYVGIPP